MPETCTPALSRSIMFRYSENCSVIEPKQAIVNQNGTPLPRNSITSLTEHFGEMTNTTLDRIIHIRYPDDALARFGQKCAAAACNSSSPAYSRTSRSMPCPWPPARSQCAYGSVAEFGSMRISYRPPIWCVSLKSGYLFTAVLISLHNITRRRSAAAHTDTAP